MLSLLVPVLALAAHSVVVREGDDTWREVMDDEGSVLVEAVNNGYDYYKERGGLKWVMATQRPRIVSCEEHDGDVRETSSILRDMNPSISTMHRTNTLVRGIASYCLMQGAGYAATKVCYNAQDDTPLRLATHNATYELFMFKETNSTAPLTLPKECSKKIVHPPKLFSPSKYSGVIEVITEDTAKSESVAMWRNEEFATYHSQAIASGSKSNAYVSMQGTPHLTTWRAALDARRVPNGSQAIPNTEECATPVALNDVITYSDPYFSGTVSLLLNGNSTFQYEGQDVVRDQKCNVWSIDRTSIFGIKVYFFFAPLAWRRRNPLIAVHMLGSHTYDLAKWQGINALMAKSHHMHFFKTGVGANILNPQAPSSCASNDVCYNTCRDIVCEQQLQLAFKLKILIGSMLATFVVSFIIAFLSFLLNARPDPVSRVPPPVELIECKEINTSAPPPCLAMPDLPLHKIVYDTDNDSF
eukprot:TRINITY_DN2086_c0_g1_i1.p1 TRINITY_DN2086_c0_g1~~TRINITY_DN2086_c0_g1_i1.p1  ORF type:complete len:471 (+),score=97.31 TRINITY_DN2086_c0_g1_i1:58-1470(+)